MKRINRVTRYIRDLFELYHLDGGDMIDMSADIPIDRVSISVFKDRMIDEWTMSRLSLASGFSTEELLSLQPRTARKYRERYPFFQHLDLYLILSKAGTVFSFPACREMLQQFFQMADRLEALFFQAMEDGLKEDEGHEFNFLCAALRAKDAVSSAIPMNTEAVERLKDVYREEGLKDFLSLVRLERFYSREAWLCREFPDDPETAGRYLNYAAGGKEAMRTFALQTEDGEAAGRLLSATAPEGEGGLPDPVRQLDPMSQPYEMRVRRLVKRNAAFGE